MTFRPPPIHPLVTASGEVAAIAHEIDQITDLAEIEALSRLLSLGLFRLAVVGEIKRGKSSFVNALLGQEALLPIADAVATSVVFKILYGPEQRMVAYFRPENEDAPVPPPQTLDAEGLTAFGTETGNPGNRRGVDFIAVELPHPLLQRGLVIYDTPGLGGLFRTHAEMTWRILPRADAVCFVLDSEQSVATRPEIEALNRIATLAPELFFLQTKTDKADAEQVAGWEARNRDILGEALGRDPARLAYFPVSSRLRQVAERRRRDSDLERSGFIPVLQHLRGTLHATVQASRARLLADRLEDTARRLDRSLAERLEILDSGDDGALGQLAAELTAAREALRAWEQGEGQRAMDGFRRTLDAIECDTLDALDDRLDAQPGGPLLADILEALEAERPSAETIVRRQPDLIGTVDDAVNQVLSEIQAEIATRHNAAREALYAAAGRTLPDLPTLSGPTRELAGSETPRLTPPRDDLWKRARAAFISAGIGATVASWGTVLLTGLAASNPLTLTITLVTVGFTSLWGFREHGETRAQATLQQLRAQLSDRVVRRRSRARTELIRVFARLRGTESEVLARLMDDMRREITARERAMERARRGAASEARVEAEGLRTARERLAHVLATIRPPDAGRGK